MILSFSAFETSSGKLKRYWELVLSSTATKLSLVQFSVSIE
jgi:hypothetical protein